MEKQRKPRVLLTGFTPFGGERINPALEAVKQVRCPEAELRILEVPTVFGDSARLVTAEMDAFRPDVVLCVGQAAGRSAVTPERVAINVDDARIPDNAGQQPVDAPIVPGGPAAYFATVPVKDMVRAIREAEAHKGPSIVICYAPCINHGIKKGMGCVQQEMKDAVASGYWNLYRYSPETHKFTLDSKEPSMALYDFMKGEVRYSSLELSFPENARVLFAEAEDAAKAKYESYKRRAEDQ